MPKSPSRTGDIRDASETPDNPDAPADGPLFTVSGDRLIVLPRAGADTSGRRRSPDRRAPRGAAPRWTGRRWTGPRWAAPYARLFTAPGSVAFTAGNLIARLPMGMLTVSAVIMIAGSRDSYALAGAVTACGLAATAVVGPLTARLVDRYGQARIMVPAAALAVGGSVALALCVRYDAPDWSLFAAYVSTATTPNTGGMSRARWAYLYRDDAAARHTANSFEQAADELCFMLGPVIAALLCTAFFPEAGTLTAAFLLLTGVLLFASQRRTEPPPSPRTPGRQRSPLRLRGMPPLLFTFLCTGAVFGSMEVVTLAFADELGHQGAAGVVLALQAGGSAAAGLVFGALRPPGPLARRFVLCVCAMAVLMTLPLLAATTTGSLAAVGAGLLLAGMATAPTMVTGMTLVQLVTPAARLNEGMTLSVTALLGGVAAGSATGGWAAQHLGEGASTGYWVPVTAAALAAATAAAGFRHPQGLLSQSSRGQV
ncbi:MFS transporter [Streptomyces sp. N2-109]|uniref:MFS transporter n=1 Tax=Streptomyces gossypii TaxID=2883101 RepID=A0ABT2JTU4_9ACTN|nr:MFS transporter [Streptomyces gossypii]MCT2591292.1 MFS transporter [Streptomyces gossypii]